MRLRFVLRIVRLVPLLALTAGAPLACENGTGPDSCCQVCIGNRKACGDSCIPRTDACNSPKGCACGD